MLFIPANMLLLNLKHPAFPIIKRLDCLGWLGWGWLEWGWLEWGWLDWNCLDWVWFEKIILKVAGDDI